MKELIEEIGHVAEVGRTLQMFLVARSKFLSRSEIIALANNTAGKIGRYPSPRSALRLSELVGFIKHFKNRYELTSLGFQYLENRNEFDVSLYQGRFLLGLFLDNVEMNKHISAIFSLARGSATIFVPQELLDTSDLRNTMRLLQQVRCFEYSDAKFILSVDFLDTVEKLMRTRAALTETALWEQLEAQRLRALYIEECVMGYERDRLRKLRCPELADAVLRISALDVAAGYDIASFENDGRPRYIEVKSSVGAKLVFEWSENEREVSEKLGESYWIYFVPLSHLVREKINALVRIQNPIQKLNRRQLLYRFLTWQVFASDEVTKEIAPAIDDWRIYDL